jgi:hypothetical protein
MSGRREVTVENVQGLVPILVFTFRLTWNKGRR